MKEWMACLSMLLLGGLQTATGQMHWWPTEVSTTTGIWLAEGESRNQVDGVAFGGKLLG